MKAFWHWISKPPFLGLPWLVWGYAILSFVILNRGGVFTGHLIGWDDQVRMTQVLNWVNGAGWYDRTIMRANAPEGFTSIWSRIVDIPIAVVIFVAQQFMQQKLAALVAAAIVPMVELAILFVAAPYFVRPLVGKNKARLIVLFLIFTSILNAKVAPFSISGFFLGEASHHPWYVILNLTMFGAAARLALGSAHRSPLFILAGSIALLTAVGIEGYPLIAGAAAIVACTAWGGGRPIIASRAGNAFLYGALGSLILLPMHQPPASFFAISFAEPSIVGVILIACAGLFLKIEQGVLGRIPQRKSQSAIALCLVAAVLGIGLVLIFPQILNGGAAGLSPNERQMALREHYEAMPAYRASRSLPQFIGLITPTLIAFAAGFYALRRNGTVRRRTLYFCYLGFAVVGGVMTAIYSRYCHHAMTTACAWLLWVWEELKRRLKKDTNFGLAVFGSFILLGPFSMLLLMAISNNSPLSSFVLLFPANAQVALDPCDSLPLANYINEHYSHDTDLLVPYWESAQFLYQTDVHIDFLANYPSHDKFIDNYNFLGTSKDDEARMIARRHNIDLVAVCTDPPLYRSFYPGDRQTMIAKLQVGQIPTWLKPVSVNIQTNYLLFAVDKQALEQ